MEMAVPLAEGDDAVHAGEEPRSRTFLDQPLAIIRLVFEIAFGRLS